MYVCGDFHLYMCIPTTDICTKYILFCIPDMYMPGINAKMYRRLFRVYYGCCVLNVSYLENFVSVIQSVTGGCTVWMVFFILL